MVVGGHKDTEQRSNRAVSYAKGPNRIQGKGHSPHLSSAATERSATQRVSRHVPIPVPTWIYINIPVLALVKRLPYLP